MRCHAYLLPADGYRELEAQILEQLRDGDREQLLYLVEENDLEIELLSGEWRLLFDAAEDYYQAVDEEEGRARMVVSPDELSDFANLLRDPACQERWGAASFGLAELTDAVPTNFDLIGLVFIEESDDWQWLEAHNEIFAIRPEVFEVLEKYMQQLLKSSNYPALARLAADHCEGSVEFSAQRWQTLLQHAEERVPELLSVIRGQISVPRDYTSIREAVALISDPQFQPSLDAWLRVHANLASYALYFRDLEAERE